ncbi:decaprenyl-diphosphate synthase subunit 2-like [Tetranychus urticae]|uniref:Decaprenyl-diphosphate synthase subunit 2 n=1 Tax=Tetranychus urticae TaxID=32264 RepID=T1JVN1_TETUR|nr:decaprenyl-diphosphate synthase subunit 2-like [Tetranychus urticae]
MKLIPCYKVFRRFYNTYNYSPLASVTPQITPTFTPKTTSNLKVNPTENWQNVFSSATFDDQWSKLCCEGEKLVHYSTTQFNSKYLDNQEITNVTLQLKKLAGTNHPLLKTAKRLMAEGNSISTSTLVVLLLAKAFGPNSDKLTTNHSNIIRSQCLLAEMIELINSAYYIHRSVLNLNSYLTGNNGLVVGNKMSILSGDYLLASVWNGLCELKNTPVVELMASSISNLMEGQFIRESESIHDYTVESWEKRNFKLYGSLMANSCRSVAVLANKSSKVQSSAYNFGLNFGLAWQLANEMKPFLDPFPPTTNNQDNHLFDPNSTPLLMHLLSSQDTFIDTDFTQMNQKQLYHLIRSGEAIELTREMKNCYALSALNSLKGLPNNDSFLLLSKFVAILLML